MAIADPTARRHDVPTPPSRRELLMSGAAAALLGLAGSAHCASPAHADPERAGPAEADEQPAIRSLPRRTLGRTGFETTIFGLGCFPLGGLPDEEVATAVILQALDEGCNYLDTAPSYARGRSEQRVGRALRERPGQEVFLASKTHTRTAAAAREDIEASLRRLGVERLDLVQVHAVTSTEDLELVLAPEGPLAGLNKAREEGLVRFVGATGHADPAVLAKVVETGAFDTLLFPLNCVDPHHLSFERGTLPTAVELGIGRIGMKVFASGNLLKEGIDAASCLRYAYGLDVSTTVVGCRTVDEVKEAARVARAFEPLTAAQRADLLLRTLPHKGKGVEWYKRA